jgi:DNA-binding transcriptional ArsR family regulator
MGGPKDESDYRTQETERPLSSRLAADRFYNALSESHRRRLLYYLGGTEESTVEELASVLSGWEATMTGTMHTAEDRSAIHIQLLHNHLPRLADADLIDYDVDAGTVQLAPLHPRVTEIIRQSVEAEQLAGSE